MILKEVYDSIQSKYEVKCLTGEKSMETYVAWTHIIEDLNVAMYNRSKELVFTTGIAHTGEEWLLELVKRLCKQRASGLVVCIGPYIKNIPQSVLNYCKQENFCLMTLPWKIHLSDVTKDISYVVLEQEKKMVTVIHAMKDAIFYPDEKAVYMPHFRRYGYMASNFFCPIILQVKRNGKMARDNEMMLQFFQNLMSFYFPKVVIFEFMKQIVVVVYNQNQEGIRLCLEQILKFEKTYEEFQIEQIGVGPNEEGIYQLSKNFQIAKGMISLGKVKQKKVLEYDDLGIYQILISHHDHSVLKHYYDQILGPLQTYDEEHGTDYIRILKVYLDADCSVRETSEIEYCHRNTINKKIGMVKEILKREDILPKDKMEIGLAYAIRDIIS